MDGRTELLEKVIGALLERFAPKGVKLSNQEIEDAPDFEARGLFETDQVELRVSTWNDRP